MVLTIDVGNTNIVVGSFDGDKLMFIERMSTNKSATVLEYVVMFKTILEIHGISPDSIDGGIVSSVVPSITNSVKQAAETITGKEILVLGPGVKTGLSIMIDDPAQLGSDLVAGAVGGANLYSAPLIIIDMGTATTISVVGKDKSFRGGFIYPGVWTSLDSLITKTSQLPNISLVPPKKLIGTNTIDCMKSGILYSSASSIDGIIDRIESELGEKCTTVATGGIAKTIIPLCRHDITLDDDLLLKGLLIIYNKNK
ncbi:MAG: type III pantothenate kinase [Ruminococcus sp.]|nr:type III pantothenate kinase [Ruminococcus sp.]